MPACVPELKTGRGILVAVSFGHGMFQADVYRSGAVVVRSGARCNTHEGCRGSSPCIVGMEVFKRAPWTG